MVRIAPVLGRCYARLCFRGRSGAARWRRVFVCAGVVRIRLRLIGRSDYATRDRVWRFKRRSACSLDCSRGCVDLALFAALLVVVGVSRRRSYGRRRWRTRLVDAHASVRRARWLARQLTAFAAAGVGLTLLALVIAYIPTVYAAFSRREAVITKLVVRAGARPTGPAVLSSSWRLGRFDQLEEVWDGWEDWFVDVGESHTTFPQLAFFRSPHPQNHWVLATEAVLDAAALFATVCDVPRQSRSGSAFMPGFTP